MRLPSILPLTLLFGIACQSQESELPVPDLGKSDAITRSQGRLDFGGEATAEFRADLEFHTFRFFAAAGAEVSVTIERRGSSAKLDTTMFVFGPPTNGGFGPDAIASDDDDGFDLLSKIDGLTIDERGEHQIVIGTGLEGKRRGSYRITLTCDNGACVPPPPDDLGTCHEFILDHVSECVDELFFDTQDIFSSFDTCTEESAFSDFFEFVCESNPPDFCQAGIDRFKTEMMPACVAEAAELFDIPSETKSLSGSPLPDSLEDLLDELNVECDDFCERQFSLFSYTGVDPSAEEAIDSIRVIHDQGLFISNEGQITQARANQLVPRFGDTMVAVQDAFNTTEVVLAEGQASFQINFGDAHIDMLVFILPATNQIFVYESLSFFD